MNEKDKVKRILFWLRELDGIKIYKEYCDSSRDLVFEKKLKFIGRFGFNKEVVLSDWQKTTFYAWLCEEEKHLQGLIENEDSELVEIARGIKDNDMES